MKLSSEVIYEIFQRRLKAARKLREWTQIELASRANLHPSAVAHFETGSRKPSFDNLRRLGNALEVTTDYLLGRVDEPGLAEAGDPLFLAVGKLSGSDRQIAKDFLNMLAERSQAKRRLDYVVSDAFFENRRKELEGKLLDAN